MKHHFDFCCICKCLVQHCDSKSRRLSTAPLHATPRSLCVVVGTSHHDHFLTRQKAHCQDTRAQGIKFRRIFNDDPATSIAGLLDDDPEGIFATIVFTGERPPTRNPSDTDNESGMLSGRQCASNGEPPTRNPSDADIKATGDLPPVRLCAPMPASFEGLDLQLVKA